MTRLGVKYAMFLLDEMIAAGGAPWTQLAATAAARRGPASMEMSLVPGFDATYGDLLPRRGDEDVAAVEEDRREAKGVRRLIAPLLKRGEDLSREYEPGGRQQYVTHTGPGAGRDYSALRDLDNQTGIEIAWEQVGPDFYRESSEPEPPLLNDFDYSQTVPETHKMSAMRHAPVQPDSGESDVDREVATQFAQTRQRDAMTPEEVIKAAVLGTMDHALDFDEPNTVVENERDPQWRNPERALVTEKGWSPAESVWQAHQAFTLNPDAHAIVDSVPEPGPVP